MSKITPERISGDIIISTPVSWQLLGILTLLVLIFSIIFVCNVDYSRIELVNGIIAPDKGVTAIVPSRTGVITNTFFSDAQHVAAGDPLVTIRVEEDSAVGGSAAEKMVAALERQNLNTSAQLDAARSAAVAQQSQVTAELLGMQAESSQIQSQLLIQEELIRSAKEEMRRSNELAATGFNSKRDVTSKQELLFIRQQQLSQLEQLLSAKKFSIQEAERRSKYLAAQARSQAAALESLKSQTEGQEALARTAGSYVIRAAVGGTISSMNFHLGQVVSPNDQLATIIPDGARLRIDLAIPSHAIGMVQPGQNVRMSIDAFPADRFGSLNGVILSVSQQSIKMLDSSHNQIVAYPVHVNLPVSEMNIFGHPRPLLSGMTVTARIVTQKQNLFTWLFEPFFAVQRR